MRGGLSLSIGFNETDKCQRQMYAGAAYLRRFTRGGARQYEDVSVSFDASYGELGNSGNSENTFFHETRPHRPPALSALDIAAAHNMGNLAPAWGLLAARVTGAGHEV